MVLRALALRMMLALLLAVSGAGASLSGVDSGFVARAPHSTDAAAAAHVAGHGAGNEARPCLADDCAPADGPALHDCHGTVSHCMPAGVLAARGAAMPRPWVRADISLTIDRSPGIAGLALDPPPPRR